MVPFVSLSEHFRMIVRLSVLVSATTATRCYLYMYAADGILGSVSMRLAAIVYSCLGSQACVCSHCCVQCAQGTCSVRTVIAVFSAHRVRVLWNSSHRCT